MLFVCTSKYQKDITPEVLTEHRDWLNGLIAEGVVYSAGRLAAGGGGLLVMRAADQAEAEAILAADPFSRDGISVYTPVGYNPTLGSLQG